MLSRIVSKVKPPLRRDVNLTIRRTRIDANGAALETSTGRQFTDQDERRGYKFDGTLDLSALIDKNSTIGHINTTDADGFRSRNLRSGAEPQDPDKAREVMLFFKNRPKPQTSTESIDYKSMVRNAKFSQRCGARQGAKPWKTRMNDDRQNGEGNRPNRMGQLTNPNRTGNSEMRGKIGQYPPPRGQYK